VTETQFGLIYENQFANQQTVATDGPAVGTFGESLSAARASTAADVGNKWYYLIYPLVNINALWDSDIDFLKAQWTVTHRSGRAADDLWKQVYGYLAKEQKSVYQVLPDMTVVDGEVGLPARGRGKYHLDNYLRVVEIRVNRNHIRDFENFVQTNVVPAVARFLPKVRGQGNNKLPRFMRTVKLAVRVGGEPDLVDLLQNRLIPAAQRTRTDVFIYRGVYSSGANYFLVFPFDDANSLANTKDRIVSTLLQRAYPGEESRRLDEQFGRSITFAHEMVSRMRPDMSSNLENKYRKWW
jgi:hypothetical protein